MATSSYAKFRDFHLWVGLILMIPTTVIALTGFLWNHEKSLGIKREHKSPRSKSAGEDMAFLSNAGAWKDHQAGLDAALVAAQATWGSDVPLDRIELKNEPGAGMVVKVKADEESGVIPYEIVYSLALGEVIERKGDAAAGVDWAKIVHDLHTGKFFSRSAGFLWSDAGASAILFLGGTGLVLYLIPIFKKQAKRRRETKTVAMAARPSKQRDLTLTDVAN